jgi:Tol biopolymer transport system component
MFWTRIIAFFVGIIAVFTLAIATWSVIAGRELPIGEEIVYISRLQGVTWDIDLMDVDRGLAYNATRPFMRNGTRNRLPQWSADGDQLAFVTEYFNQRDILIMNPAESTLRFLTSRDQDETDPVWSPDGQRVAYSVWNGSNWDIYINRLRAVNTILVQESSIRPFVGGFSNDRLPQWSPDGSQVMFISDRYGLNDLFLIDSNGRNLQRLTSNMGVDEFAAWSPTGTHIAVVSARDTNREIYLVNVATGAFTNLTHQPRADFDPAWSPDGSRIAFVSDRDGDNDIYVMDADGDNLVQITHNNTYDDEPNWSADNKRLVFVGSPGGTSEIFIVDLESGSVRQLTNNQDDDWSPVWRP